MWVPEHVGFGLHRMTPRELRADFQALRAWREDVCEVLEVVLAQHEGPVIAPMTVVEPRYFAETVRRLRERGFGHAVQFVAGHAAALRRESFAVAKLDRCLDRLQGEEFAEHLRTDHLSVPQVADCLAASVGLCLAADADGPLRGRTRRAWTGARQIRLGG